MVMLFTKASPLPSTTRSGLVRCDQSTVTVKGAPTRLDSGREIIRRPCDAAAAGAGLQCGSDK
jgi:hypothetical protein